MLLNLDRARETLDRENLDGLIAQLPINVYYLSDYWGLFNTAGGYDAAYLAVLPRDERQAALISSRSSSETMRPSRKTTCRRA